MERPEIYPHKYDQISDRRAREAQQSDGLLFNKWLGKQTSTRGNKGRKRKYMSA